MLRVLANRQKLIHFFISEPEIPADSVDHRYDARYIRRSRESFLSRILANCKNLK